jgi:hypothetical protein
MKIMRFIQGTENPLTFVVTKQVIGVCSDEVTTGSVNQVSVGDNASSPSPLGDALKKKLKQLKSAERAVLIPLIAEYHDVSA